jgi:hypothetical protein
MDLLGISNFYPPKDPPSSKLKKPHPLFDGESIVLNSHVRSPLYPSYFMATSEPNPRSIATLAQGQIGDAWPLDHASLTTTQGPSKRRFGPQTPEGLARCAAVRTKHGRDTKVMRDQRRMISAALRLVEDQMYADGLISGPKRVGRKPGPLARPDEVWTFIKGLRRQPPPRG